MQTPVEEFTETFKQFLNDNPEIKEEFDTAWYNADPHIVNAIVRDFVLEYEVADVNPIV